MDSFYKAKAIIVSAQQQWTATNIDVHGGNNFSIIVDGIASSNASSTPNNPGGWTGPEGQGNYRALGHPMPEVAGGCVIGKIGAAGKPFYVGKAQSFRANISGRLYLGYNDNVFFDNYGYYVAFVFCNDCGGLGVGVSDHKEAPSTQALLLQNHPNPFNPSTVIEYQLPKPGSTELKIFDINGRLVKTLLSALQDAGHHSIVWDGKTESGAIAPSGTYFYQVRLDDSILTKNMLLLK